MNKFLHSIKNYYKRKKYGAGCCDTHDLFVYLGKLILPALLEYRRQLKSSSSVPFAHTSGEHMTFDEWKEILDKMIYSFEAIKKDQIGEMVDFKKQQEGFELFGEYYSCLWL